MDLAKVAISTALYFVPPPVMLKLRPAIVTVFNQLSFYSGAKMLSEQPDAASAPLSADIFEAADWTAVSAPSVNDDMAPTDLRRRLQVSDLEPCSNTKINLMLQGNDGVTLNFPVPANTTSVNVSFQQSAPGCVGIALAASSEGGPSGPQDVWGGVNIQGVGGGSSRPPFQDMLTYLELFYCVSFIGGLVFRAMGPVLEYALSVSKVAFITMFHVGTTWLAKLLRFILASLPEGA